MIRLQLCICGRHLKDELLAVSRWFVVKGRANVVVDGLIHLRQPHKSHITFNLA